MPPSPHARHPSRPRGSGRAAELGRYREGGRDRETLGAGEEGWERGSPGGTRAARGAGRRAGTGTWRNGVVGGGRDEEREQEMRRPWAFISPGLLRPAPLRTGAFCSTPRRV